MATATSPHNVVNGVVQMVVDLYAVDLGKSRVEASITVYTVADAHADSLRMREMIEPLPGSYQRR